jgi:hypothetical protein
MMTMTASAAAIRALLVGDSWMGVVLVWGGSWGYDWLWLLPVGSVGCAIVACGEFAGEVVVDTWG